MDALGRGVAAPQASGHDSVLGEGAVRRHQQRVVDLRRGTLHNQTCDVSATQEHQRTAGEIGNFNNALNNHRPIVQQRLNALRNVLNDLSSRGKI